MISNRYDMTIRAHKQRTRADLTADGKLVSINAKQKHLGCKKVRGQSEAALQTGATKNFDIS